MDLSFLDSYDWREAFSFANFKISDVTEVLGYEDGENDGANWIIYGRLQDGRYFFLSAGCDYTGWDCQASGHSVTDSSLSELIRMGMGEDDRDRLGLKVGCLEPLGF